MVELGFLGKYAPSLSNDTISMFIWGFLFLAAFGLIAYLIRQFVKYRYKGEVHLRRQDDWQTGIPQSRILEGKAAYITKRGRTIFRIRYGYMPWQLIDIKKLPNPNYMVGNKAYFLQYNIGELVQAKKIVDWNTDEIKIEPVDNTTKDAAKLELTQYAQILSQTKVSPIVIGLTIMGIVLVTGIVTLYFINKGA